MKPVPHPGATHRLAAPADWSPDQHGDCSALEIADVVGEGGLPFMESLWQPDVADLAALNARAAFAIGIQGHVHPVIYAGVTAPPRHDQPAERRET